MSLIKYIKDKFHKCKDIEYTSRKLIEVDRCTEFSCYAISVQDINVYVYYGICLHCKRKTWTMVRINKDFDIKQPFDK